MMKWSSAEKSTDLESPVLVINCNNRWSAECYSSQKIVLFAWLYVHHGPNSKSNLIFTEMAAPLLQEMMKRKENT